MTINEDDGTEVLERAFPFHFVLDGALRVLRAGHRLRALAPLLEIGESLGATLRVERPEPSPTFARLQARPDDIFILDVTSVQGLRLRGQFFTTQEAGEDALIFLGHPWITELAQLERLGLVLSDFPPHTGTGDMLVLLQIRSNLANQLQAKSKELRQRNEQLEEELERRKKLEDNILQSQKMEAIGELAGGVAHDFNNILLAISGHASLATAELDADHPAATDLQRISDATRRAAELTARLLAFGRRQIMVPTDVDVASALDEVDQILKPLLGEHVRLAIKHPRDVGVVEIDPSALQQILLNLAINARDSFEEEGWITIEAESVVVREARHLTSGVLEPGMWIAISVSDDGSGMDQGTIERIFEPFFTTKDPGQGTGLGLSTVWWILERCGGKIDVDSYLGKGTKFVVYLPSSNKTLGEKTSAEEDSPETMKVGRILLVEDEDMVRFPVAEMLRRAGWQVTEATNGEDAIKEAEAAAVPFDITLTDMIMPGMDGRELATIFRKRWPSMRVVVMTGYDAGAASGMFPGDEFILTKPFTSEDLIAMLERALEDPDA